MSNSELALHFFAQVAFILVTCRAVGLLAKRLGQPQVVGEMIAGVVLGPSLFGWLLPGAQNYLFPKSSMAIIYAVSQVGLVLYMFLVGVEFNSDLIRRRLRTAASVSIAGILAPFILGGTIAVFIVRDLRFFPDKVSLWEGVLFMGAAMSITAFPMLARIIYERGLTGTSLGTLALAAGSIDDAAAWCLLAIVLASFSGNVVIVVTAIGGGLIYVLIVLFVAKPLLAPLGRTSERTQRVDGGTLALVLMLVMVCAWFTDFIGIYPVFGGFILGTSMPRGFFGRELQRILEPLTTSLLLPLFFVYSGLNTRMGLVDTTSAWVICVIVLLAACLGKGLACWLAARLNGEDSREAMAIGVLMNARGLMELIILNIGLERGIISPTLFTIMVTMAICTTLLASPLFEYAYRRRKLKIPAVALEFSPGG